MRNKLKYLIALIALMSCEDEKSIRADYIIENQTTYNLSITGYTGAKAVKTIEIKPNSTYKERVDVRSVHGGLFDSYFTDSVVIDFGAKRKLVQFCESKKLSVCNVPKNLITISMEYYVLKRRRKRIGYDIVKPPIEVIFDQIDYDRAVPY